MPKIDDPDSIPDDIYFDDTSNSSFCPESNSCDTNTTPHHNDTANQNDDATQDELDDSSLAPPSNSPTDSQPHPSAKRDRVELYCPLEGQYYSSEVTEVHDDGACVIEYDDADVETLNISKEMWRYKPNNTFHSNAGTFERTLQSPEGSFLKETLTVFGNRPFMLHHAQGFEQFPLVKTYRREEKSFTKTVKRIPRHSAPRNANIIWSHTIYRIKAEDDLFLQLKARIAPQGNKDTIKNDMKTHCYRCPP